MRYRTLGGEPQLIGHLDKLLFKKPIKQTGFYLAVKELGLNTPLLREYATKAQDWDNDVMIKAAQNALAMMSELDEAHKDPINGKITYDMEKITQYATNNAQKGDVELGEKMFYKANCIACHANSVHVAQKGPYLGAAGSQFKRDYIIESILKPYAAVAQGFPTYSYELKHKKMIAGFKVEDKKNEVHLMNIAAQRSVVRKANIVKKKIIGMSQMPPGTTSQLTLHEFNSLVDYLVSLKD